MAGGENTSGLFLCPVLGGRYALGGVHSKISMTPFKFADYQEFERRKGYDESIHLKNNSPQEWEEISFSAFSKARRNGCFTGRFFVETVKMFRDEDDRIIMECSRKDFEKYQQEDRHSRYLQEHEKSRSIFPASHVGDRDGTEEGYQDTDLFVDESVDTAEQAIQNLLLEDLHQALLKLSPAERDFILSYYEMKIPNATCLAQRYGITRQAADKRLKKLKKNKKVGCDFLKSGSSK